MAKMIDAEPLYEEVKRLEELAQQRVIDTPSRFPNRAFNPAAVQYAAQLYERTRFREMLFDAMNKST